MEDIQPFSPSESDKLQEDDGDDIDERSPRLRHRQATSSSAKKKNNSMVLEEIDIDDFEDDFGDDFI